MEVKLIEYEKEISNLKSNEILLKNKIANLENKSKQENESNEITRKELFELRNKYQTQLENVEQLNNIIEELKTKNEILNAKNSNNNEINADNNVNNNKELDELKKQNELLLSQNITLKNNFDKILQQNL